MNQAEEIEQCMLAQWLDFKRVHWLHIPNGGLRHIATARKLKMQGVKAGAPDILIFTPPPRWKFSRPGGVAIELKAPKGGRVSPAQQEWLDKLKQCGWHTCVANGAAEAIKFLEGLGY